MTTIAYRDGIIASDSRSTFKQTIDSDRVKKLFRLSDGSVIGMSGDWTGGMLLKAALEAQIKTKKKVLPLGHFKCNAILVCPDGKVWFYETGLWTDLYKFKYDYYASGSGFVAAMAAMDVGATAKEAVAAGIKRDVYSGGKIQSYKVF